MWLSINIFVGTDLTLILKSGEISLQNRFVNKCKKKNQLLISMCIVEGMYNTCIFS